MTKHANFGLSYHSKIFIFIYVIAVTLFSMCLFLYGFFPIINYDNKISSLKDIPTTINNTKINTKHLYKPLVKKIIIMVIDALRWDFVNNADATGAMPVTRNLINSKTACFLPVRVNSPTVTMPRLKAITTGTVSSFIDVALNFGDTAVTSDNILLQAKNHGHKLIFYGDDTWLKLYPNIFFRYEGTTSFYVNDYIEVDNNVTRHLDYELNYNNNNNNDDDWTIMILHYLGLDHIGHLYGAKSSLINPKLQEMDKIIGRIVVKIDQWNKAGTSSMLIISGDHGMKDSGGHGGATSAETLVPLVAYGVNCSNINHRNTKSNVHEIDQIDIATTVAVLLGIPLPASNAGSICPQLLESLSVENKLFALYYNAKQVFEHFRKLSDYESHRWYYDYMNAIRLHLNILNSKEKSFGMYSHAVELYQSALNGMKNIIIQSMIHYNLPLVNAAIVLMAQVLLIMLNFNSLSAIKAEYFFYWWISSALSWYFLNHILYIGSNDIIEINNLYLMIIICIPLTINCYLCAKVSWRKFIYDNYKKLSSIYFLSIILHVISLGSSSFVEEEHQTWYFYWTTFLILELVGNIEHFSRFYKKQSDDNNIKTITIVLFLLIQHRALRKLNSTGNKYAHLPDISGWMKYQQSNTAMSVILLSGLGLLFIIECYRKNYNHDVKKMFIYFIMAICIYQRHVAEKSVVGIFDFRQSRSKLEIPIFWTTLIIFTVYSIWDMVYSTPKGISCKLFELIIKLWVFISALLHRPFNLILLPIQLISHSMIYDILKFKSNRYKCDEEIQILISYCLGNVFYFYQGNSSSLATVDVAVGLIGLKIYNFYIATLFLCINTFSAKILAYLILLYKIYHEKNNVDDNLKLFSINRKYIILILFSTVVYTVILTFERYHLFVWTVFSPKLLYESMYCAFFFCTMTFIQMIFIIISKINKFFN